MPTKELHHVPVLLKEIIDFLVTDQTVVFFDGTLGLGGHAEAILQKAPQIQYYLACDLDLEHLEWAKNRLKPWKEKLKLKQTNFSDWGKQVEEIKRPEGALSVFLDLGVCSNHLDDEEKGFAFRTDGPLGMSFDGDKERCKSILNKASENKLIQIFKDYGETPQAPKVAREILKARTHKPIETTEELKNIIDSGVYPQNRKKIRSCVFQALRIEVNQELDHLEKALHTALEGLRNGDRMGVIAYHSLEDRMVKNFFKQYSKPKTEETIYSLHQEIESSRFKLLTKNAIKPLDEEISENPRSRSARLRVIEKQ